MPLRGRITPETLRRQLEGALSFGGKGSIYDIQSEQLSGDTYRYAFTNKKTQQSLFLDLAPGLPSASGGNAFEVVTQSGWRQVIGGNVSAQNQNEINYMNPAEVMASLIHTSLSNASEYSSANEQWRNNIEFGGQIEAPDGNLFEISKSIGMMYGPTHPEQARREYSERMTVGYAPGLGWEERNAINDRLHRAMMFGSESDNPNLSMLHGANWNKQGNALQKGYGIAGDMLYSARGDNYAKSIKSGNVAFGRRELARPYVEDASGRLMPATPGWVQDNMAPGSYVRSNFRMGETSQRLNVMKSNVLFGGTLVSGGALEYQDIYSGFSDMGVQTKKTAQITFGDDEDIRDFRNAQISLNDVGGKVIPAGGRLQVGSIQLQGQEEARPIYMHADSASDVIINKGVSPQLIMPRAYDPETGEGRPMARRVNKLFNTIGDTISGVNRTKYSGINGIGLQYSVGLRVDTNDKSGMKVGRSLPIGENPYQNINIGGVGGQVDTVTGEIKSTSAIMQKSFMVFTPEQQRAALNKMHPELGGMVQVDKRGRPKALSGADVASQYSKLTGNETNSMYFFDQLYQKFYTEGANPEMNARNYEQFGIGRIDEMEVYHGEMANEMVDYHRSNMTDAAKILRREKHEKFVNMDDDAIKNYVNSAMRVESTSGGRSNVWVKQKDMMVMPQGRTLNPEYSGGLLANYEMIAAMNTQFPDASAMLGLNPTQEQGATDYVPRNVSAWREINTAYEYRKMKDKGVTPGANLNVNKISPMQAADLSERMQLAGEGLGDRERMEAYAEILGDNMPYFKETNDLIESPRAILDSDYFGGDDSSISRMTPLWEKAFFGLADAQSMSSTDAQGVSDEAVRGLHNRRRSVLESKSRNIMKKLLGRYAMGMGGRYGYADSAGLKSDEIFMSNRSIRRMVRTNTNMSSEEQQQAYQQILNRARSEEGAYVFAARQPTLSRQHGVNALKIVTETMGKERGMKMPALKNMLGYVSSAVSGINAGDFDSDFMSVIFGGRWKDGEMEFADVERSTESPYRRVWNAMNEQFGHGAEGLHIGIETSMDLIKNLTGDKSIHNPGEMLKIAKAIDSIKDSNVAVAGMGTSYRNRDLLEAAANATGGFSDKAITRGFDADTFRYQEYLDALNTAGDSVANTLYASVSKNNEQMTLSKLGGGIRPVHVGGSGEIANYGPALAGRIGPDKHITNRSAAFMLADSDATMKTFEKAIKGMEPGEERMRALISKSQELQEAGEYDPTASPLGLASVGMAAVRAREKGLWTDQKLKVAGKTYSNATDFLMNSPANPMFSLYNTRTRTGNVRQGMQGLGYTGLPALATIQQMNAERGDSANLMTRYHANQMAMPMDAKGAMVTAALMNPSLYEGVDVMNLKSNQAAETERQLQAQPAAAGDGNNGDQPPKDAIPSLASPVPEGNGAFEQFRKEFAKFQQRPVNVALEFKSPKLTDLKRNLVLRDFKNAFGAMQHEGFRSETGEIYDKAKELYGMNFQQSTNGLSNSYVVQSVMQSPARKEFLQYLSGKKHVGRTIKGAFSTLTRHQQVLETDENLMNQVQDFSDSQVSEDMGALGGAFDASSREVGGRRRVNGKYKYDSDDFKEFQEKVKEATRAMEKYQEAHKDGTGIIKRMNLERDAELANRKAGIAEMKARRSSIETSLEDLSPDSPEHASGQAQLYRLNNQIFGAEKKLESAEKQSPISSRIRRMLGGWGMMYMQRIAGLATSPWREGYNEMQQYQQSANKFGARLMGDEFTPYASPETALQTAKLQKGGGTWGAVRSMQAAITGGPIGDLGGAVLAGASGTAMASFLGASTVAGPIGLAVGGIALAGTMAGYGGKNADNTMLSSTTMYRNKDENVFQGMKSYWQRAGVFASRALSNPFQNRKEFMSDWRAYSDKMSSTEQNYYNFSQGQGTAAGFDTQQFGQYMATAPIESLQAYAPEVRSQAGMLASTYGLSMDATEKAAQMYSGGTDLEKMAMQIAQQTNTPLSDDALGEIMDKIPNGTTAENAALMQGMDVYSKLSPAAREQLHIGDPVKWAARFGSKAAASPNLEVLMQQSQIAEKARQQGWDYKAPVAFSVLASGKELSTEQYSDLSEGYSKFTAAQAFGDSMKQAGVSNVDRGYIQQIVSSVPDDQKNFMNNFLSGDPLAVAQMAFDTGDVNLSNTVTSDVNLNGMATGQALFTNSLMQGGVNQAANIWGADWRGTDPTAGFNGGIRAAMNDGYTIQSSGGASTRVGGLTAAKAWSADLSYNTQMAQIGTQYAQMDLSYAFTTGIGLGKYKTVDPRTGDRFEIPHGGMWGIQDRQFSLNAARTAFSIEQQEKQFELSGEQYYENRALQQRQMTMNQASTMRGWSFQDQTRDLQWQWGQEDFQERVRFMSGRERKQAETQMRRQTTMKNIEDEQTERQREEQKEIWKLQKEQFDLQRIHYEQSRELQKEAIEKNKEFQEENLDIQHDTMELQRAQFIEQMKLQEQQLAISAGAAELQHEAAIEMALVDQYRNDRLAEIQNHTKTSNTIQTAMYGVLNKMKDSLVNLSVNVNVSMGGWRQPYAKPTDGRTEQIDELDRINDESGIPGLDYTRAAGGSVWGGHSYRVNEEGEEYFRPLVPGTVRSSREAADPWSNAVVGTSQIKGDSGSEKQPIIINIGNKRLGRFVVDSLNREIKV